MTYTPPATQEDLDRIIAERLSRQKTQLEASYADYADLKAKAEQFDQASEAAKSDLQKALDKAAAAEKKAADLQAEKTERETKEAHAKQVADWTAEVAEATNVPAGLLRGATKEELQAHAEALKPVIVAQRNGVVPTEGRTPVTNVNAEERQAVAKLFGTE